MGLEYYFILLINVQIYERILNHAHFDIFFFKYMDPFRGWKLKLGTLLFTNIYCSLIKRISGNTK